MNTITHEIKLDFSLPCAYKSVYSYRFDAGSRILKLVLTDNKEPYVIPDGASVYFYGEADGTNVMFTKCSFEGNIVTLPLTHTMTSPAAVIGKLRITDPNGNVVTTPPVTIFNMDPVDVDESIKMTSDFTALLDAIRIADAARIVSVNSDGNKLIISYNDGCSVTVDFEDYAGVGIADIKNTYDVSDGVGKNTMSIILTDGKNFDFIITDGADGSTPYIKNGNWWIGDIDTGVTAEGKDGADGAPGKDGTDGTDGTMWHCGTALTGTGEGIMSPVVGAKTGDYYLNISTGAVYVSTNSDTFWDYKYNITGPQGEKGATGATGATGDKGSDGNDGKSVHYSSSITNKVNPDGYYELIVDEQTEFQEGELIIAADASVYQVVSLSNEATGVALCHRLFSIKGNTGDTGAAGKDGVDGSDGADGKDGNAIYYSINEPVEDPLGWMIMDQFIQTGERDVQPNDLIITPSGSLWRYNTDDMIQNFGFLEYICSIKGANGTSVTVSKVTESTASGGTNVVTFSDGSTLNVKNGKDGADGADGATASEVIAAMPTETWTFTLFDGSTVEKVVPLI